MDSIYETRPWLRIYPDHVPPDLDLPLKSALDDFITTASRYPEKPAVHYFDHTISFGEVDAWSSAFAAALKDLGICKGDRVLLDLQNVPQFLIGVYGAWKAGAIVVPVNPMSKDREMDYSCRDSGAKVALILDEVASTLDLDALRKTSVEHIITTSALDFLPGDCELPAVLGRVRRVSVAGALNLSALLEKNKGRTIDSPDVSPKDVAYLTYTSGTTGQPKAAMNTHENVAFNARVYRAILQIDEGDVLLGVAPLFHVTGEVAHLATAALSGVPLVLFYRFDPAETLRLIERWKVTSTVASITVYIALMNHPDIRKRSLSSFIKAYSGGAPVSEAIVDRFQELTGLYIYNVYGLTETNSPSHIVPWRQKAPVDPESGALSVGVPVPSCTVKIMDLETGQKEVPPGDVGEIVISGPIVIPGYWEKPLETSQTIRNGWLFTGDVGKMDADGWFYVVDRKKDMIVASGYKVWPRDVEDVIYQHPAVREAAVVGEPDPYRGETVKAFVVLKDGMETKVRPEDIISFCKSKMAAYKYPRKVVLISEIPKTLTGKFLRRALREEPH
ncbi:MAG: AMP-binding protein [Deltaproteobacteria bacterium]|nr:AMP-binding protein [Deltaproteobacteria bacterium]